MMINLRTKSSRLLVALYWQTAALAEQAALRHDQGDDELADLDVESYEMAMEKILNELDARGVLVFPACAQMVEPEIVGGGIEESLA